MTTDAAYNILLDYISGKENCTTDEVLLEALNELLTKAQLYDLIVKEIQQNSFVKIDSLL